MRAGRRLQVSPGDAAVILRASQDLPDGASKARRQVIEAPLVEKACTRPAVPGRPTAVEAVEPEQKVVDTHKDQLVRSEEGAARDRTRLFIHDNGVGTDTGHFTVPRCHRHHRWVHDTRFRHQTMPDGAVRCSGRT